MIITNNNNMQLIGGAASILSDDIIASRMHGLDGLGCIAPVKMWEAGQFAVSDALRWATACAEIACATTSSGSNNNSSSISSNSGKKRPIDELQKHTISPASSSLIQDATRKLLSKQIYVSRIFNLSHH